VSPIKIILGGYGTMGSMIYDIFMKEYEKRKDIVILGAIDPAVDPVHTRNIRIFHPDKISFALEYKPDIWMDFSTPEAACANVPKVVDAGVKPLIGTTGFTPEQKNKLLEYIREKEVPCMFSSNYAFGVHVTRKGVIQVAKSLKSTPEYGSEYDVGILDVHHRRKKDVPSGTLDMLKNDIMGVNPDISAEVFRTRGRNPRKPGEMDLASQRLGTVPGEHTVRFSGPDEEILIIHRAYSRVPFARGALEFARILHLIEEPEIYTENNLLELIG